MVKNFWIVFWKKEMVFYYDNKSQGSSLSLFAYSFYTTDADCYLPVSSSLLQFMDDLAIYALGRQSTQIFQAVEDAFQNLNRFSYEKGLKISETKSEVVVFFFEKTCRFSCLYQS
jgi:Reverse transcriptase (RNA-dependent DNA polymerase)